MLDGGTKDQVKNFLNESRLPGSGSQYLMIDISTFEVFSFIPVEPSVHVRIIKSFDKTIK